VDYVFIFILAYEFNEELELDYPSFHFFYSTSFDIRQFFFSLEGIRNVKISCLLAWSKADVHSHSCIVQASTQNSTSLTHHSTRSRED
jgi:hypothetical protein